MKNSIGILLYRYNAQQLEFFLVYPGGPFYKTEQDGAWTFPKGEAMPDEVPEATALREFQEETGFIITESLHYLDTIKLRKGKTVTAFACQQNIDPTLLKSNLFELEYPKHSGQVRKFPEIAQGQWFSKEEAVVKIHPKLLIFIEQLTHILHE